MQWFLLELHKALGVFLVPQKHCGFGIPTKSLEMIHHLKKAFDFPPRLLIHEFAGVFSSGMG
jgi:hypothetical protein